MRSQFREAAVSKKEAPEGHIWFDLVTPDLDTFKTRLRPEGGRFRSEARPWLDAHNQSSCRNQIGKMVDSALGTNENGPVFQVLVWFDLADPNAAEIYRKHNTLASDGKPLLAGCSVGFDPISKHIEIPHGAMPCALCDSGMHGDKVCIKCRGTGYEGAELIYDEWAILEGSSCSVPSNPTALMRSAADAFSDTLEAAEAKRQLPVKGSPQTPHHPKTETAEVSVKKGTPMKPEHRSAHRQMVGNALFNAEDHMRAAADMGEEFPEGKEFHEKEAAGAMKRAATMCRMIHDSMKAGHEDAPEDAAMTANMVRSAPKGVSEELAKEWASCQRAALPFADTTFAAAAAQIGAKSPRDLVVQHRTNEQIIKLYNTGKAQERKAALDAEQRVCGELIDTLRRSPAGLEPGLEAEMLGLDPADPSGKTRMGKPWTSEELRRMVVRLEGVAPVVTRPSEIRSAETTTEGAAPVVPAQPPQRPSQQAAGVDPAVAAFLADSARRTGADATVMQRAAQRMG